MTNRGTTPLGNHPCAMALRARSCAEAVGPGRRGNEGWVQRCLGQAPPPLLLWGLPGVASPSWLQHGWPEPCQDCAQHLCATSGTCQDNVWYHQLVPVDI